jgi:CheY-like chemotaxis protein
MESVGRLAGGVAHDFNNMLSVILGYTGLALDQMAPDHPLRDHLQQALSAAQRSAEITRQLLAFARKQTIAPRELDLNETVEGMLKMLRRLIGEDVDLIWQPGPAVWPVMMDPTQIDQILANLCVNARDAISGVGTLTIETATAVVDEASCAGYPGVAAGNFVILSVSDNGCGMDRKTLEHLFEPFFTTKDPSKGTGLGLATVDGIVRQNHGFVDVRSQVGLGTTFQIYLPALETAEDAAATGAPPATPRARTGETVLVVEDESAILRLSTMMLEALGYTVLTASAPAGAVDLAQRHAGPIHLLITDVVMPDMNGKELARQLLAIRPDARVLFMSGYTADVIAHHGVLDPGVQFIQKPFSMHDIGTKVRQVLDAP